MPFRMHTRGLLLLFVVCVCVCVCVRVMDTPVLPCKMATAIEMDYVSSCEIWAGRRPPLGSSQAERSVISEGCTLT